MAHSLKIVISAVYEKMPGNGRVLVTFLPRYKVFWKNFPQPKFYTRSTAIPTFVFRESTHPSVP